MIKQYEVLNWASSFLQKYNREKQVADILLQHHLKISREQYYLNMHETVANHLVDRFKQDIEQHALKGIPYQHLIGYEYFYERKFSVNEHVLIPRQETEELVYHVIKNTEKNVEELTIVDIGTGSGVIAITLALEIPHVTVYATDISDEALKVAKQNAQRLNAQVQFLQGDFLQPIIEKNVYPHVIVSNPPYIKMSDEKILHDTVKKYDPHIALFAENDGLKSYETILTQATELREKIENIYFEIGFDQGEDVLKLASTFFPQSRQNLIKDINRKDRVVHISF